MDSPKVVVVLNQDMGIDVVEISIYGLVLYSLPVSFIVTLNRFFTELPRAFDSRVFLHAIVMSSVVNFHLFEVRAWESFDKS